MAIENSNKNTSDEFVANSETQTDARIKYPCYKSFDEFIDVEKLKSLDSYIAERIERRIAARNDSYFYNTFRLNAASPEKPGAREIWLARAKTEFPFDYFNLDKPEMWERAAEADEFSLLTDFIKTLPFRAAGRMLIIYDDAATSVPAHRDHIETEICHDFIWMRTNLKKPFYMLNHKTGERKYVESYSAWFDSVNQFHGTDSKEGLSFSIRVDGVFTDEFKKLIPKPERNAAPAPALWACV